MHSHDIADPKLKQIKKAASSEAAPYYLNTLQHQYRPRINLLLMIHQHHPVHS